MANHANFFSLDDSCQIKIFGEKKINEKFYSYLTASDHYGLKISMKINKIPKSYIRRVDYENLKVKDTYESIFMTK